MQCFVASSIWQQSKEFVRIHHIDSGNDDFDDDVGKMKMMAKEDLEDQLAQRQLSGTGRQSLNAVGPGSSRLFCMAMIILTNVDLWLFSGDGGHDGLSDVDQVSVKFLANMRFLFFCPHSDTSATLALPWSAIVEPGG